MNVPLGDLASISTEPLLGPGGRGGDFDVQRTQASSLLRPVGGSWWICGGGERLEQTKQAWREFWIISTCPKLGNKMNVLFQPNTDQISINYLIHSNAGILCCGKKSILLCAYEEYCYS